MPSQKGNIVLIIISILALLSLSAAGYLFYQNQQLKSNQLTPSGSNPIHSNWQTCKDSRGFTVKYPADFMLNGESCNYSIADYSLVQNINVTNGQTDLQKNWLLGITIDNISIAPGSWILANKCSHLSNCSEIKSGPLANSSTFNIDTHYFETDVVASIDNKIVVFSLNARNPDTKLSSDTKKLFDQILSTFKFTNPGQIGLTKYQHPNGEYEFSYPSNWTFQQGSEGCGPLWYPPNTKTTWLTVCALSFDEGITLESFAVRQVGSGQLLNKSNLTIGQHKAIKEIIKNGERETDTLVIVGDVVANINLAQPSGKIMTEQKIGLLPIHLYSYGASDSEVAKQFDQILETFYFPLVP